MIRSPDNEILAHTQLPGVAAALSDIPLLKHEMEDGSVGVVAFVVHPDAAFYRLSPESALRLREEITHRLNAQLRETDRLYGMNNWEWLILLPNLRSSATLTMAMIRLSGLFSERGLVTGQCRLFRFSSSRRQAVGRVQIVAGVFSRYFLEARV